MEYGIVLDANDIKTILAKYFGVDESSVIKSQYSWTIKGVRACEDPTVVPSERN